jgi:hypothetical protein
MTSTPSCLIIVCAHAVFHGTNPLDEFHWDLQQFQRGSPSKKSEHHTFMRHIQEAINLLQNTSNKDSLLVFSGGPTNSDYPNISEAQGYLKAATWLLFQPHMVNHKEMIENHLATEERATDTFQNILFSILKFHEIKQQYPSKVVVVTHAFKSRRVELHRSAISWTRPFHIEGIDPEFDGTC